jgi:hypothetical protein
MVVPNYAFPHEDQIREECGALKTGLKGHPGIHQIESFRRDWLLRFPEEDEELLHEKFDWKKRCSREPP